jgi:hypothetical protein
MSATVSIEDLDKQFDADRAKLGTVAGDKGGNSREAVHHEIAMRRAALLGPGYMLPRRRYRS